MELKVWVEGIQRVVCGVNEATTCQDVVYALAHATGQTGRFTLVEKWRHSERLLPPQEYPLKVLTKWGEYAGDVQLILRRITDKKSQSNNNNNNNKNTSSQPIHQQIPNKKLPDLWPFSPPNVPSALAPAPSTPTQNKEIKKSLTFSGSHSVNNNNTTSGSSGHSTPQNTVSTPVDPVNLKSENSREPQGKVRDSNRDRAPRQDVPRGIVKGVPQERSSPARPRQPPSYDEAVSRSSRHHLSSQPPPFNLDGGSPSSNRLPQGPHISPMPAKDHRLSPNRTADPYVHHVTSHTQSATDIKRDGILSSAVVGTPPKDAQWSSDKVMARKNLIGEFKKDSSPRTDRDAKGENVVLLVKDKEDPQYRDLIRLVTLQREKLTNQNAELSQFDTEIVYWEGKLQEQESRLAVLEEEICHLERLNEEQSREMGSLDHPSQMEILEVAHQDERLLRSKLSVSKAQLTSCDTQLTNTRQRIKHLGDDVSDERRKNIEREREMKERDEQCQDVKKQMKKKEEEQNQQVEVLSSLEKELHVLEEGLSDRQGQLDKLTLELRDANLQALSMTIADDIKCLSEGSFHTRSGSTRRILGSPRQLENAVPTSKNPHGVWV